MTEEPSFTTPEETGETELTEAPPEPDTRPRTPIRITFQDGKSTRRKRKEISLNYHEVRCSICNHPDRKAIEQGYLHWESPTLLAYEYGLGRRRAIYRHAQALGLRKKRGERTRRNLEFVMEQAENTTATASDVIRAVRAYSCLSEDGQWTEPTKRVVIEHVNRTSSAQENGHSEEVSGPELVTRHSPLATEFDGHACPSKNAATPAPSTKLRKLMGTLFNSFGTKRR